MRRVPVHAGPLNERLDMFDHISGEHFHIDGAKIYAELKGDPSLEPLLFLHGGFGNIEDFNPVIPLLRNKYRLIGIDSRGQGKSTLGNEKLSYERIQRDVEAVLRELGVESPAVIGFSDGGIVAYRLACLSSLKIGKLITMGSRWHFDYVQDTRDLLEGTTAERWKARFPDTVEKYNALNPEPDFERLAGSIVPMWLDGSGSGYPNEKVKEIKCSALIMRGDRDHLFSRSGAFRASELIAGSDLANIPFAGHVAFMDQTEAVMKFVNDFLER